MSCIKNPIQIYLLYVVRKGESKMQNFFEVFGVNVSFSIVHQHPLCALNFPLPVFVNKDLIFSDLKNSRLIALSEEPPSAITIS